MQDQQERVIRYLDDCWAVEKTLASELKIMAREVNDPTLKTLFEEHLIVTEAQEARLADRIKAYGKEPSRTKSFFTKVAAKIGSLLHRPHDEEDGPTQILIKAFAIENFEMAMYQALAIYAEAIGDKETVTLAYDHLHQEKAAADLVWFQIPICAQRPAELTATIN